MGQGQHVFPWLSQDPNAIVIPKDRTAEIATLLAQPAPSQLRILTWNIDGLDEVGGGGMKYGVNESLAGSPDRPDVSEDVSA